MVCFDKPPPAQTYRNNIDEERKRILCQLLSQIDIPQAVVPKSVVRQMNWKDGDILDWEISFLESKRIVMVRKTE